MSAAPAPISLSEYLNTDYEPDCDYVDGFLEERNVGKKKHSRTQTLLTIWLGAREEEYGFTVLTEQRVQVTPRRVRVPDICLVKPDDTDEIIQHPPLLWIEILSPEDRWKRIQTRLNDALNFGVPTIWIIDPYEREAWIATREQGTVPVEDGWLRCIDPALEVTLEEILPER
jgi:Uma2 family endonuclease